jgi:hypothetical protein|uniref:DUF1642 domain-containing protein n=1 Tax=Siphoviridae sp. ctBrh2 TaxID=2827804 RepID=A0A8S5S798_9CAUD|nr:MAG TPA: Protein of unknown function (DUF1642) [Siphoviridae sp. ctBrh2]
MNKQELINSVKAWGAWCTDHNTGEKDRYVKIDKVRELIEQLDEKQKVTVPKFAADWIERCKEKATLADCLDGYYEISNGEVVSSEDFQNWVVDNENDELTAKAWMFGYEVEKEPLYQIQFPGTSWGAYLTKADNGDLVIFQNTTSGSAFTESEIKAIDERYWAFAVPVEEVK